MKKRFFSLFVCTALLLSIVFPAHTAWADSSSGGGDTYTDPDTGLTFVVPDGWNEQELDAEAPNFLQVQFVSQQGAGSTLLYGSVDLWNAATASERSGLTRSDFNSNYIYTLDDGAVVEYLAERFVQGAAEVQSNADVNDIQLVTYGENEFIEYSVTQEVSGIHFPLTMVFFVENGYMHIFMFSAFGGTSGQAVQDFHAVLSSLPASPGKGSGLSGSGSLPAGGNTYTDPDTGASFVVPEGWEEDAFNLEDAANFYQVKYTSQKNSGSLFLYGSYDLWSSMSESERSGHTRSEVDSAYIYEEWSLIESFVNFAPEQGVKIDPAHIQLVTFGENEFIEIPTIQEMAGIRVSAILFWYVENGDCYIFSFGSTSKQATQDFHSVLSSLQVSPTEAFGSGGTGSGQPDEAVETYKRLLTNSCLFLLELGVTFLLYALPFVIYRNAIRKRPVSKKVLLIIFIVLYEFVAWVLLNTAMAWFLRGYANFFCAIFWGWYSYRKMVRRKDTDAAPQDENGSAAPQQPIKAALSPQPAAAPEPPVLSAIPAAPVTPQSPPATPAAPVLSAPAAYIPAEPMPAAPAPQASPATPVSPAPAVPVSQAPSFPEMGTPASPARQTPPAAPRIQFCRNCGFRLLDDSKFCSVCGTPVVPMPKE